ncbi:MAG: aldolase [Methylorubrum populi]
MSPLPPCPAPRLAVVVADPAACLAATPHATPHATDTLVLEPAVILAGPVPRLRAARPDLTIYATLDGADDPALDGIVAQAPDGLLLRDARSGRDVADLGGRLAVREAEAGLPDGGIAILAAIHHPLGVLDAQNFVGASPRLGGLGLDRNALAASLGEGDALVQARGMIRIAAAAAGVTMFEVLDSKASARPAASRQEGLGLLVLRESTR